MDLFQALILGIVQGRNRIYSCLQFSPSGSRALVFRLARPLV